MDGGEGEGGEGERGRWQDATAEVGALCEALGLGGMVMREGFTLQESMNALELMSPKMDTGMNADAYEDLAHRLAKGKIRVPVESLEELDWVAAQVLIRELAWHDGHLLAASVYACAHLCPQTQSLLKPFVRDLFKRWQDQQPDTPAPASKSEKRSATANTAKDTSQPFALLEDDTDEVVLASVSFVLFTSIIKSCGVARLCIRRGDIYEEEDWSSQTFGLPLGENSDVPGTLEMINFAQDVLRAAQASGRKAFAGKCERIAQHLLFRALYLQALHEMLRPNIEGWSTAEKLWAQMAELVPVVGPASVSDIEPQERWKAAFDADIHRKLLASAPPRAGPTCETAPAQLAFANFIADMQTACALRNTDTLFAMYNALMRFSRRTPSIVVRSLVMLMLYCENELAMGRIAYEGWIMDDLQAYGVPVHLRETEECRNYAKFAVKHMYDVLRMLLANRARQRRNIANLLPDWAAMQQEAELYDHMAFVKANPSLPRLEDMTREQLRENMHFYMGSWATEWTIRLMLHHLTLGFELDLYNINEYAAVFWYGQDLMARFLANRDETTKFNMELLNRLTRSAEDSSLPKKAQRSAAARCVGLRKLIGEQKTNIALVKERLCVEVERLCLDGLLRFVIGLAKAGRFPPPQLEFGSDKIRYNHRFTPYSYLAMPRFLPYESFAQVTNMENYETRQLLENAALFLEKARSLLASAMKAPNMTDVEKAYFKALFKVVISNNVNVTRALESVDKPLPEGARPHVEAQFPSAKDSCFFPVIVSKE
ncbi:N-alpha-acetyltransferase 35, NatC auxiliary subunit [Hondaea fermentalgiana]|uniref:N-alpha-acetyltransferase 35, NatC auxiliary subunit n=1 Tax=Hondaea fermentalgiana TaxID=2315210 RepID=A0A2R5GR49_9STRA|nr:N-alpha-acetyltransferase 35, NatC auxiliary subunit [Hondaea fermentalgiana]|eukprot:GBG31103.1 N-alpha-acetyltransferase 35, NatC auxiliary subunit [Hondaea fermentalgiana]